MKVSQELVALLETRGGAKAVINSVPEAVSDSAWKLATCGEWNLYYYECVCDSPASANLEKGIFNVPSRCFVCGSPIDESNALASIRRRTVKQWLDRIPRVLQVKIKSCSACQVGDTYSYAQRSFSFPSGVSYLTYGFSLSWTFIELLHQRMSCFEFVPPWVLAPKWSVREVSRSADVWLFRGFVPFIGRMAATQREQYFHRWNVPREWMVYMESQLTGGAKIVQKCGEAEG